MRIEVNRSWLWAAGGVAIVAVLVGMVMTFSPGRQLARAFDRLVTAAESRDWKTVRRLVADDYRDAWGYDANDVILNASDVMQYFVALRVEANPRRLMRNGRRAEIAARIQLFGRGSPVAEAIKTRVNELPGEFQFAWEQKSWKPWDWKLVSVGQNELDLAVLP